MLISIRVRKPFFFLFFFFGSVLVRNSYWILRVYLTLMNDDHPTAISLAGHLMADRFLESKRAADFECKLKIWRPPWFFNFVLFYIYSF